MKWLLPLLGLALGAGGAVLVARRIAGPKYVTQKPEGSRSRFPRSISMSPHPIRLPYSARRLRRRPPTPPPPADPTKKLIQRSLAPSHASMSVAVNLSPSYQSVLAAPPATGWTPRQAQ